jgi:glycosyltransferase involved in cell wall biosynthesis
MIRPDLVVFSHLPWTFVWQRPQHLILRIGAGRPTWFVEECRVAPGRKSPGLCAEQLGPVTRVWFEIPGDDERLAGFGEPDPTRYADAVSELLGSNPDRTVWTYTPMALPLFERLDRALLVYDVMDDLASFAFAPPGMRDYQDRLLAQADVVFTGGRSIHAGIVGTTDAPVHLFPSGVEPEHYAGAKALRRPRARPVAGYVGVIDERIDLDLIAELAARLPGWDIQAVGPVFKISPDDLPRAPNIVYLGMKRYDELPAVLSGFDVALMPFALNEATRSISPTKTLEYLAAGLPVVSTRVPDVVADFRGVVELRDDAEGFARACEHVLESRPSEREAKVRPLLRVHHWDTIAARMQEHMDEALQPGEARVRTVRTAI